MTMHSLIIVALAHDITHIVMSWAVTQSNTYGHPRQINDRGNDARSCLCN